MGLRRKAVRSDSARISSGGYFYENEVSFKGDNTRAFDHAHGVFFGIGFRDINTSANRFEATGPGMNKSSLPPLRGVTKIRIDIANSQLRVEAELGGVRFLRNSVIIFPPALALGLGGIFFVLSLGLGEGFPAASAIMPVGLVLPWLFIVPIMIRGIRNKTTDALDNLIEDMRSKS